MAASALILKGPLLVLLVAASVLTAPAQVIKYPGVPIRGLAGDLSWRRVIGSQGDPYTTGSVLGYLYAFKGSSIIHLRFTLTNFSSPPAAALIGQGFIGQPGTPLLNFSGSWIPVRKMCDKKPVPKAYLDVWVNNADKSSPQGSALSFKGLFLKMSAGSAGYYGAVTTQGLPEGDGAARGQLSQPFPFNLNPLTFDAAR